MTLEIRPIEDAEVPAFREAMMTVFGSDLDADPNGPDRTRALVDLSRAWAAFDGTTIAATAATFDHTIVVPGGTLAMAGLTMVTVRPTHRRRGLLRRLIALHLDDARSRGVAISGLWASEASIYGRFGYGVAAEANVVQIEDAATLDVARGRELDAVEWIEEARAREVLPPIYARAVAARPGALIRSDTWWRERRFLEAPFNRGGASRLRHVVARRGAELVGYVQFRQRGSFTAELPSGSLEITELIAIDPRAEATLWAFACNADLFPKVTWWNAPVDDPLPWLVGDARRVARKRTDNLWLRIDDIGATLAARRYSADGTLRLAVEDTTWELAVEAGRARCAPTSRAAELRLARPALGSLFLGGFRAAQLARADLVHGDAAAIATADRLFATPLAPWCPELF